MFTSLIKISGHWDITLIGPDGAVKQQISGKNVITTVGKEYLASYLLSATTSATNTLKHIAIGTSATPETAADTGMGVELARTTGTISYVSGGIYQITATFPAGTGTGAIVEYGLFSSSTGGTLFARSTKTVINKGAGDSITATHRVTFS